jgi:hypothetical protein
MVIKHSLLEPTKSSECERKIAALVHQFRQEISDDELRLGVQKALQDLTETIITSVTGYQFIIDALVMAGI